MGEEHRVIYVCPECFAIAEDPRECTEHEMTRIDAGVPGDERTKPLIDEDGNLKTRAPAWWVERYAWWVKDNQSTRGQ